MLTIEPITDATSLIDRLWDIYNLEHLSLIFNTLVDGRVKFIVSELIVNPR